MPRQRLPWLKLYSQLLDNEDFNHLPSNQQTGWFRLLLYANRQNPRGSFQTANLRMLARNVGVSRGVLERLLAYCTTTWVGDDRIPHIVIEDGRGRFTTWDVWQRRSHHKESDEPVVNQGSGSNDPEADHEWSPGEPEKSHNPATSSQIGDPKSAPKAPSETDTETDTKGLFVNRVLEDSELMTIATIFNCQDRPDSLTELWPVLDHWRSKATEVGIVFDFPETARDTVRHWATKGQAIRNPARAWNQTLQNQFPYLVKANSESVQRQRGSRDRFLSIQERAS
jgi:hypothetical protein